MPEQKTPLEFAAEYRAMAKRARRLAGYLGNDADRARLLRYAEDLEAEAAKLDDTLIQ